MHLDFPVHALTSLTFAHSFPMSPSHLIYEIDSRSCSCTHLYLNLNSIAGRALPLSSQAAIEEQQREEQAVASLAGASAAAPAAPTVTVDTKASEGEEACEECLPPYAAEEAPTKSDHLETDVPAVGEGDADGKAAK